MKKAEPDDDEMRAEYRREDLGPLIRGKYAARFAKTSNIVIIDPTLTKAFPNAEAVNAALRGLLAIATSVTAVKRPSTRTPRKRATG